MIDRLRRFGPAAAALACSVLLAACQTGDGSKPVASAAIGPSGSKAIAFESIDGPPEPVFDKLVANLTTEAGTRKVSVASRDSNAPYRVRGYLAASVENGKGSVDWAWDVFDADRERVLRVSGVEPVGEGKDVWNRIDDATIQRIAAQSLDEISTRLAAAASAPRAKPAAATPAPEPELEEAPAAVPMDDGPPIASADEAPDAPAAALTFAAHP